MTAPLRHRLFVDQPLGPATTGRTAEVPVEQGQAHYLVNVLRLGVGDRLLAFNDRDGEFEAEIASTARKSVSLGIIGQTRPRGTLPSLMLAFAPVKRARIDFIAEKATELGVGGIQPVMTEFTSVARVNTGRMAANAIEAAEQTGRLTVPTIHPPVPLARLLEDWPKSRHLVYCDEQLAGDENSDMAGRIAGLTGPAAVLIGPEGGFSPVERNSLDSMAQAVPVSLGPNILRSDTAVVAALSVWQATVGDWRCSDGV